jgi:hypothetical protein
LLFAALAVVSQSTRAMTVLKLSDDQLVGISRLVVEGRVMSTHCEWTADHSDIQTIVTIRVERLLKGQTPRDLELRLSGGRVGDEAFYIPGQPKFAPGEDVLIFIRKGNWAQIPIAGMGQGKFSVVTDPASGQRMIAERGIPLDVFVGKITKLVAAEANAEGGR